ncbi:MAG: hypothetical protein IPL84_14670 [Chitinophagaceae bacterium]|nr:hypothetical protein [Chitinophagaceae bacterium]
MRIDNLNELPDWDDHELDPGEKEGEAWKPNPTRDACKAMYIQWNSVMTVIQAAFDSMPEPEDQDMLSKEMLEDHMEMITADAFEVAVKIKSSESGNLYIIRMENAAIIRKNAQFIKISTNHFIVDGIMDPQHRLLIREEIDRFKELYRVWVNSFVKDDIEDEWGLFN